MKKLQFAFVLLLFPGFTQCVTVTSFDPVTNLIEYENHAIFSVDWCGCELLALGEDGYDEGLIQIYGFDPLNPGALENKASATTIGISIYSVAWCDTCRFLAAGGYDWQNSQGAVQLYSFDPEVSDSLTLTATETLGGTVSAVDWCNGCEYLVAGGYTSDYLEILQVYRFDSSNPEAGLVTVGDAYTDVAQSGIKSVKWCSNCQYIAAVGYEYISIFSFDPEQPDEGVQIFTTLTPNQDVVSVDWCADCSHFAVNGYDYDLQKSFIAVYTFEPTEDPKISLVASTTLPAICKIGERTLSWCGCNNLAVGEYIEISHTPNISLLELYHFDGQASLDLQQTLMLEINLAVTGVAWCGNCDYLAVGGGDDYYPGFLQIFKANKSLLPAPTLRVQKNFHRLPTQLDIVNTACWDAVTDAISYNVYSDSGLQALLAQITRAPYCYSQHQIMPGKAKTYYITAVDIDGNDGTPASITM